ncbi:thioesterase family protein [Herbaspirillum sp. NPDC087042]|uniref:thioesterase family protein n=1 Tax=Herbaspirillum sp. NPDC087042 TaxID=3364004 RepID=UPI0037F11D39
MPDTLAPGLRHEERIVVTEALTVPAMSTCFSGFADMPPVFATAFMVGLLEWTCVEALKPFLASGERTVGTHVDVSHCAATPVGMAVTASVELVEVDGKRLRFVVECYDSQELIGAGTHERYIVDGDRFIARVSQKALAQTA